VSLSKRRTRVRSIRGTTSRLSGLFGHLCMVDPIQRQLPCDASTFGLNVRHVSTPSGELAYIDEGTGPAIVLLHGGPFTSLAYVRVVRALRDRFRVIAPDLPGFGQSRAAPSFGGSLADYARSVEEFCEAIGLARFTLFGCDASGSMALAAAANMPAKITGLVVADTVPLPMTGRAWFIKMALRHVVGSGVFRWLNRKLNFLPWVVATVDPLRHRFSASERAVLISQYDTPEKRDRIIDVFLAMGYGDAFMRQTAAAVCERLADTPALLLFGQFDPLRLCGAISRFREMFRRSAVAIIPHEKHFPFLGGGDEVARAIADWVTRAQLAEGEAAVPRVRRMVQGT
jgi:haloalkane dehalogenase